MNILVIGGTRFFGIHMVNELLTAGYDVTIATRGKASDSFGDKVKRIFLERTKEESVREALSGTHYDVVIDKIAYCSNDIKYVMDVIDCDKYIYMSSTSVYNPKHINTVEADFDGIENEKERIYKEKRKLNPVFIELIENTLEIYRGIFAVMCRKKVSRKELDCR